MLISVFSPLNQFDTKNGLKLAKKIRETIRKTIRNVTETF